MDLVKGGSYLIAAIPPERVFTPEDLTEDERMIAETARQFVEKDVLPVLEEIEEKHAFEHSVRLMKKAGELGLLAGDVPEKYGGLGLPKTTTTLLAETLAPARSFALTIGAHTGIGTLPIVFFGTEAQKQKYLPALAGGEKIAAYALTEAGSGSDALGARTKAVLNDAGTHYILNGEKQWITNSGFADVFVVYAKVDGEKFTAFIVERDFPGVRTGPEEKKMGIKGSSTRTLILEDVPVPVDNVLGEVGRGHVVAFNILNIGRFKLAAGAVGAAKRVIELSARYAKERKQFGRPIADFALIQAKLGEMAIRTYAAESLLYRTAGYFDEMLRALGDRGDDGREVARGIAEYAIESSVNKVYATEALDYVVDEGVQIHGGYGYMAEYEVEKAYRDSRINRIFEGTNEINRLLIPDMLLKKARRGELDLLGAARRLEDELLAVGAADIPEGPLGEARALLEQGKKIFLFVAGTAVQKYGQALEAEQELLAAAADLAIDLFALESSLLRAEKALARSGEAEARGHIDLARAVAHTHFDRIERVAREALAAMEEGDLLRTQLSVLRKLTRRTPANLVALRRTIARRVLAADGYTVRA
ncbi:acyl-CoA dehydrogenase family protein [Hydrogenibacillus schlegelii]|uniref:Acyl-CoA dehydrogenase n=1 Tax=Hydrogenibacillus schlegelii TaxID=1484 RepID=A0A179IMQ3_HYDSH|nr:acyl-CoA dehydrogenase family protein [Hydrogenibacillus schlegelii]OAR03533.1 acyl-CoA dehydrogenase [Hydrogenibacillus schlegelii]